MALIIIVVSMNMFNAWRIKLHLLGACIIFYIDIRHTHSCTSSMSDY